MAAKLHWTQKPENKERLKAAHAKAIAGRTRSSVQPLNTRDSLFEQIEDRLKAEAHDAVEKMDTSRLNKAVARLQQLEDVRQQAMRLIEEPEPARQESFQLPPTHAVAAQG